ncbi:COX15/CtaA family protein [Enemella sp. A6]|uniref:COX15/CtaA family protein n=1 Tax=Enemella sp. A6 TaxID=3440152 RepID=UPI003EC0BAD1
MVFLMRHFRSERALRGWSIALLIANMGIVLTGGLVRVTGSGLGCPTWPQCTQESFVPEGQVGIGEFIEFGNRLLTFVLVFVALGMMAAAQYHRDETGQRRPGMRTLALLVLIGMPTQAIVGGIVVLTQLPPSWVAIHLWLSLVLIALSVQLVRRAHKLRPKVLPTLPVFLVRGIFVVMWVTVLMGTLTTGAGPHAGDADVARNGLNFLNMAKAHAWTVWAMVAATVLAVVLIRSRAAIALLVAQLLQGLFGYLQIFDAGNGEPLLPMQLLVAAHMLLLTVVVALTTNLMLTVRRRTKMPVIDRAEEAEARASA